MREREEAGKEVNHRGGEHLKTTYQGKSRGHDESIMRGMIMIHRLNINKIKLF